MCLYVHLYMDIHVCVCMYMLFVPFYFVPWKNIKYLKKKVKKMS